MLVYQIFPKVLTVLLFISLFKRAKYSTIIDWHFKATLTRKVNIYYAGKFTLRFRFVWLIGIVFDVTSGYTVCESALACG